MIVSRTFMDPDIFFFIFFFILVFLYGRMTGNKRPFSTKSRERGGEATSSDRRPRNLTEREGEITSFDKRPRYIIDREDEATSSDKRPRREATEVVEGIYCIFFYFIINISYWIEG